MTDVIQVITATADREDALRVAQTLVEKRLAGCVQVIGPITSVYRWEDETQTEQEWLCVAKSSRDAYGALERALRSVHPYEVPEILAVPVAAGSADYVGWLHSQSKAEMDA
jgi:periplasmic divalent cation tolerance protein